MRQIVIDELSPLERDNLDSCLKRTLKPGPMVGIYWFVLPSDLHSEAQQGHDDCGPYYLAVDLEASRLCFELLVRSTTNLHCSCIAYTTPVQRQFILDFIGQNILNNIHLSSSQAERPDDMPRQNPVSPRGGLQPGRSKFWQQTGSPPTQRPGPKA